MILSINQDVTDTKFAHVYIAREDGDYDFLLSLTGDRRDLLPNVVRALQETEEVDVVYSDDEPVDVLCFHDMQEINERISA
jgi:hypothetical protein